MFQNLSLPRAFGGRHLLVAALLALLALSFVAPSAALAHERRSVGGYDLVVGFFVEPALEGEKNGLDLRISKGGTATVGAEKTLKFEISHVQTKSAAKAYPVKAVSGTPGRYTADFFPTLSGQYAFRISGNIEGTPIDATFTSGPNTFSDVNPVTDLQVPIAVPQVRELVGTVRATSDEVQAMTDAAKSARMLAIAGIAVGAIGLLIGASALVVARGKRA